MSTAYPTLCTLTLGAATLLNPGMAEAAAPSAAPIQASMATAQGPVSALNRPTRSAFYIKGQFGFGGTVRAKAKLPGMGSLDVDSDLRPTAGGVLGLEFGAGKFLRIGVQAGPQFWMSESDDDLGFGRSTIIDASVVVKGGVTLLQEKLSVYASLPVGFSVNIHNSDIADTAESEAFDMNRIGLGYNLALLAGAGYRVSKGVEPFLNIGWAHHGFRHKFEIFGAKGHSSYKLNQFALEIGVNFMF